MKMKWLVANIITTNTLKKCNQYLEDTDEPYDEALDWVVMFHDVVYDENQKGSTFC